MEGCGVPSNYSMGSTSWTRAGKGNKIGCRSLLLPCSLITGWNCGCFWFLGFFLREGWWTKIDVKNFCGGKQFLMQVQSHVRLHPQIFCGYTTCCDAWGPGRRLTGASLLKYHSINYDYLYLQLTTMINHVFQLTTVKSSALHNKESSKSAWTPSQNFRHQPIVDIGKLTATGYRQSSHPQTQNVTKLPGSHVMSHPITAMLRNACLLETVPLLPAASVAWRHA